MRSQVSAPCGRSSKVERRSSKPNMTGSMSRRPLQFHSHRSLSVGEQGCYPCRSRFESSDGSQHASEPKLAGLPPKQIRVGAIPTGGAMPCKPNGEALGCNPGQGVRFVGMAPVDGVCRPMAGREIVDLLTRVRSPAFAPARSARWPCSGLVNR